MRRAKAHSPERCQSGGRGADSPYSTEGYSRKGSWANITRTKAKAQQKGKRIFSNSRQDSFMRASLLSCHSRVRHRANLYCNEMPRSEERRVGKECRSRG